MLLDDHIIFLPSKVNSSTCKLDPILSYLLSDVALAILPFPLLNHRCLPLYQIFPISLQTQSNYFSHLKNKNKKTLLLALLPLLDTALFANMFPFLAKLLEQLVYIHSLQFFFSHTHNCSNPAFVPTYLSKLHGQFSVLLLLDLLETVDIVNPSVLLDILSSLGFQNTPL